MRLGCGSTRIAAPIAGPPYRAMRAPLPVAGRNIAKIRHSSNRLQKHQHLFAAPDPNITSFRRRISPPPPFPKRPGGGSRQPAGQPQRPTPANTAGNNLRQRNAVILKSVSTIGYAAFPIALALLPNTPHFAAAWRAGSGIAFTLYLAAFHHKAFFRVLTWKTIGRNLISLHAALTLLSRFDTWIFILATSYISVATAAIIAESSTVLFIINMAFLHRRNSRYQKLRPGDAIPATLSITGFVLASAAETGHVPLPNRADDLRAITGIALALATAVVSAAQANSFAWAHRTARKLSPNNHDSHALFASVALAALTDFITAAIPHATQRNVAITTAAAFPLAAGAMAFGIAGVTSRKANIIASNFSMNLVSFARPVVFLPVLALTAGLHVHRPSWLIIGAALIIGANVHAALRASRADSR